jgi:hypothetical protein
MVSRPYFDGILIGFVKSNSGSALVAKAGSFA